MLNSAVVLGCTCCTCNVVVLNKTASVGTGILDTFDSFTTFNITPVGIV